MKTLLSILAVASLVGTAAGDPYLGQSVVYKVDNSHSFVATVVNVIDSDEVDIAISGWGTLWTVGGTVYTTEATPVLYVHDVVQGSGNGQWTENGTVGAPGAGFGTLVTSSPSRSLNSTFTPSNTKVMNVSYSVSVAGGLTLSGGVDGYVSLRINGTERARCGGGQTGSVVVGVAITQPLRCQLTWFLNPADTVNLTTVNVVGSPSYAIDVVSEQVLN